MALIGIPMCIRLHACRDLKCDNILVNGTSGIVKLADMGEATGMGVVCGGIGQSLVADAQYVSTASCCLSAELSYPAVS